MKQISFLGFEIEAVVSFSDLMQLEKSDVGFNGHSVYPLHS